MSTPWSVGRFDGSEAVRLPALFAEDLLIHFRTPFLGGKPTVLDFWIIARR